MFIEPKLFGRCEAKNGIVPIDRPVGEVMNQEPIRPPRFLGHG